VQRLEADFDEHRRIVNMFQQATYYNVKMTNILLKLSDMEIKNKQIIEEKDKSIHNLQGALEKEQKLKEQL
jgi:hypothetical protein